MQVSTHKQQVSLIYPKVGVNKILSVFLRHGYTVVPYTKFDTMVYMYAYGKLQFFSASPAPMVTAVVSPRLLPAVNLQAISKVFRGRAIVKLAIVKNNAKGVPLVVHQHVDHMTNKPENNEGKDNKPCSCGHSTTEAFADAEHSKSFHRYSPERNEKVLVPHQAGSIWTGTDAYARELVAASSIEELKEATKSKTLVEGRGRECRCIKKIRSAMAKVYTKRPSIARSEAVYNTNLLFPCLEAIAAAIDSKYGVYFLPGEEELEAMSLQLKQMKSKVDKRKIYKADGVVRLAECGDLEVLLLETTGAFCREDHGKEAFDNSKGIFAMLAMLKTIADKYKHAPVESFRRLKLYFVQPSDDSIRLWSMQYAKHGTYNFVREKKVVLTEEFEEREEEVSSLVNFFFGGEELSGRDSGGSCLSQNRTQRQREAVRQ